MAMPMDEQRILAEIEHHLVRDDPTLAVRLASMDRQRGRSHEQRKHGRSRFRRRQPGRARSTRLRGRRAVVIAVALVLVGTLIAAITAVVRYPSRSARTAAGAVPDHALREPVTLQLTSTQAYAPDMSKIPC